MPTLINKELIYLMSLALRPRAARRSMEERKDASQGLKLIKWGGEAAPQRIERSVSDNTITPAAKREANLIPTPPPTPALPLKVNLIFK
jgi:hypothetical protein